MLAYIFDIIIILLLVFFAWRGGKKGLILTLFGLAGLFVAFFGARFVSATFYEPVSNIIQPGIYQSIHGAEAESAPPTDGAEPDPTQEDTQPSLGELLDLIESAGLFSGFSEFLENAVNQDGVVPDSQLSPTQALSAYLAKLVARVALFALSFLLILLLWFLLSHALDLAFHLPVLSAVNKVGGVLLGLVKAVLIAIILVWLGQLAGWVPAEPTTPVLSLFTTRNVAELLNRLLV